MSRIPSPSGKTWFAMPYALKPLKAEPEAGIRYPERFVRAFLEEFTRPGDVVLDPFAGFGTTLFVAQRMKRIGIGVEYDRKRAGMAGGKLRSPSRVIHGDSRKIGSYGIGLCDFCMTSPPYMQRHHKEQPLTNYTRPGGYKTYLAGLRSTYAQIKKIMKPDAAILLEISNISGDRGKPMTTLAWDVAAELSEILFFERELVYCHSGDTAESNTGQHSYCLLFKNR
jgi:hypothetical protein